MQGIAVASLKRYRHHLHLDAPVAVDKRLVDIHHAGLDQGGHALFAVGGTKIAVQVADAHTTAFAQQCQYIHILLRQRGEGRRIRILLRHYHCLAFNYQATRKRRLEHIADGTHII